MVTSMEDSEQPQKEGVITSRGNKRFVVDYVMVQEYLMLPLWRRIILPCPVVNCNGQ